MTSSQLLEASALQMMEVIAKVKSREWMVKLIQGLIFGPAEGDKGKAVTAKKRSVNCSVMQTATALRNKTAGLITPMPDG